MACGRGFPDEECGYSGIISNMQMLSERMYLCKHNNQVKLFSFELCK